MEWIDCADFARYSAQDYYWLYPGDPSDLDADNDGAACEESSGNSPGPQIPAEPVVAQRDVTCTDGIDNDGDGPLDMADFDWDMDAYYPQGSKCDQIDAKDPIGLREGVKKAKPKPARLLCNKFVGRNGRNVAYRTKRPRRCAIWPQTRPATQAITFTKAHWTRWGKSTARAGVTLRGNSGFRARARIKAYRLAATARATTASIPASRCCVRVGASSPSTPRIGVPAEQRLTKS